MSSSNARAFGAGGRRIDLERDFPPPLPAPGDGLRLRAKTLPIGQTSLGRGLERNLLPFFDDRRRRAGAALARAGRIRDLQISDEGVVTAEAVGSERYQLRWRAEPFTENAQKQLLAALADDTEVASALASGRISPHFDELLAMGLDAPEDLLPTRFLGRCQCPYGQGCKHMAGLSALIVEAVDAKAPLILQLRGIAPERTRDILAALSAHSRAQTSAAKDAETAGDADATPATAPVITAKGVDPTTFWREPTRSRIAIPETDPESVLARLQPPTDAISPEAAASVRAMLVLVLRAAAAAGKD